MNLFRTFAPVLVLLPAFHGFAMQAAEPPSLTAEAIMARVAANQDRAEAERDHYVYVQHARIVSRKGRTVMCEEITDSRVTPSSNGSHAELIKLDGRQLVKHEYVAYTTLLKDKDAPHTDAKVESDSIKVEMGDDDMDRNIVEHMRSNLTNDKSKDGVAARLFPLTTKNQGEYQFHLVGREKKNGRDVFHVSFQPKSRDEYGWKGDAYIDTEAFQPVMVSTAMARKVPFAVRTLLGTNVPGLGFTIVYAPQPDGVWFPVSLGTEFRLHVLFFLNREIVIDAQNRSFEKTHVTSRIVETAEAAEPHQ